jgi:proteasome lid subunit RPN8/RPN11
MADDVARHAPEEACGLVAGVNCRSVAVYPIENALHSPVRFRMEPQQQVKAYLEILGKGWDLAAIYHSHPEGPVWPSPTDIAEAAYPEVIYLIWIPDHEGWNCRGYQILDGQFVEVPICIETE